MTDSSAGVPLPRVRGRFQGTKRLVRAAVPLAVRKQLARFLGRRTWLSGRYWWVQELLRDFAVRNPNAYHRFLWANHLAYAETYEVELRFGPDRIHPTRRLLFEDLEACLIRLGSRSDAIKSVFEVGCSLGYNLRFLETEVFRAASVFEGCDIDAYAVERGNAYLESQGSRVRLSLLDMAALPGQLGERRYDVMLCAGVLMYLRCADAEQVVSDVLRHTSVVAAFAGLANPAQDNALMRESGVRSGDATFIHDLDGMVVRSGGCVVQRRWEGSHQVGGNTVYFVFATPAPR